MNDISEFYVEPKFRPGVEHFIFDDRATFRYYKTEFDVEFEPSAKPIVTKWMDSLSSGLDLQAVDGDTFSAEFGRQLMTVLDRYGFLHEATARNSEPNRKGRSIWSELAALSAQTKAKLEFSFSEALADGAPTRAMLALYATQYYHVVCHGPRIIAAAYAQGRTERARRILEEFFVEERGHDKLLKRSLDSIGVRCGLETDVPMLPETFGLIRPLSCARRS